jgi:TPP-dependent 2-oxoacid decarboxylase
LGLISLGRQTFGLALVHSKKHVGNTLDNRDAFLSFALILKDFNSSRFNPTKDARLDIIINWLNNLTSVPSMNQKLELIDNIKKISNNIKADKIDILSMLIFFNA